MQHNFFCFNALLILCGFCSVNAQSSWVAMGSALPQPVKHEFTYYGHSLALKIHLPGFYKIAVPRQAKYRIVLPGAGRSSTHNPLLLPAITLIMPFSTASIASIHVECTSQMVFAHIPVALDEDTCEADTVGHNTKKQHGLAPATAAEQYFPMGNDSEDAVRVSVRAMGKLHGLDVTHLSIFPFRSVPGSDDLYVAENFRVMIQFSQGASLASIPSSLAALFSWRADVCVEEEEAPPEYLVITPDAFVEPLQPLIACRTAEGMKVTVKTIGDVKREMQWNALLSATKLQNYISRYYSKQPNLMYVLLVGDVEHIPVKYQNDEATDLHYSLLDGSGDFWPDVYLGRLPVNTAADVTAMVEKIIDYEKTEPGKRVLLASYFQDTGLDGIEDRDYIYSSELFRAYLVKKQFTCQQAYTKTPGCKPDYYNNYEPVPADIPFDGTVQDVLDFINIGAFLVNHRDHGDTDGWGHPPFHVEHIPQLWNRHYPLMFNVDCTTGKFDMETAEERRETEGTILNTKNESFSEQLLHVPKHGMIAIIAPTRETTHPVNSVFNQGLMEALWPQMFDGSDSPATRLGQVIYRARIKLVRELCPDGVITEKVLSNFRCYHVLGDPALRIRPRQ